MFHVICSIHGRLGECETRGLADATIVDHLTEDRCSMAAIFYEDVRQGLRRPSPSMSLSDEEAVVLTPIVHDPGLSLGEVAKRSGTGVARVGRWLERLHARGLIARRMTAYRLARQLWLWYPTGDGVSVLVAYYAKRIFPEHRPEPVEHAGHATC